MKPTKEQLEKINRFTKRPLTEDEVSVVLVEAGSKELSAYYTSFDTKTLKKFAYDLQRGDVAASIFHKTRDVLPPGRSFDGYIVDDNKVYGWFYIPHETDEFGLIKRLEYGTIFDVSMGVNTTFPECSICHNDLRDFDKCKHYPGQTYQVETPTGMKEELCYAILRGTKEENGMYSDVSLSEVSFVTDGAIPGAGVKDFQLQKTEGGVQQFTSTQYYVPAVVSVPSVSTYPISVEVKMDKETIDKLFEKLSVLEQAFNKKVEDYEKAVAEFKAKLEEKETELAAAQAKTQEYQAALAEILVMQRTKLEGNAFDAELSKKEFMQLSAEDAVKKYEDLKAAVEAKFSAGRKTPEEPLDSAKNINVVDIHPDLFKV